MPRGIELPARKVVWDLVGNLCCVLEKACGGSIQGQVDQELMGALMGTALFYVCEINRGETNEIILSSSYEFSTL